mmetsp:Transcript_5746/g.21864  ORF Transcript_5746/g.21864 Transcript_5746/m.21864 type:complete len:214 (-) Transcript_5746:745-1386(-)
MAFRTSCSACSWSRSSYSSAAFFAASCAWYSFNQASALSFFSLSAFCSEVSCFGFNACCARSLTILTAACIMASSTVTGPDRPCTTCAAASASARRRAASAASSWRRFRSSSSSLRCASLRSLQQALPVPHLPQELEVDLGGGCVANEQHALQGGVGAPALEVEVADAHEDRVRSSAPHGRGGHVHLARIRVALKRLPRDVWSQGLVVDIQHP